MEFLHPAYHAATRVPDGSDGSSDCALLHHAAAGPDFPIVHKDAAAGESGTEKKGNRVRNIPQDPPRLLWDDVIRDYRLHAHAYIWYADTTPISRRPIRQALENRESIEARLATRNRFFGISEIKMKKLAIPGARG